ncbi:MAG: Rv1355c family protein [Flavobacteriales bacterium]|nr:Rv1355c family protein [Flavobacteriales bacterium]HRH69758.1 Rv1355c family protein [Flavobacteriales bacterium]
MDTLLEALDSASAPDRTTFRPVFFRLSVPDDRARLEDLLKREPHTVVHDELRSQLRELVRTLNPSVRFTAEALDSAAMAHLQGVDAHDYGVWVHYPWAHRLVHLLDEREFVLVRTDRNRNKITDQEQATLGTKRIGVIGLSVGQSVCLTLALERSFGELRIADFDTLELSNLNRIRSATHAMGQLKTVNVAREIAEIDPFLKVTLFNEGLSRANIGRFCTEGGKLDVLVDECDSVDVKILCRQKAKELHIPVLMDTSDRGMLDIERFDLEPDRSILHGLIDHLDIDAASKARTNEEKLPFILPIAGIDTLSPRMKASMLEIENSVTTWPQLASSVVMGGGVVGEITRRVCLGQNVPSGRWWLDPDELLGKKGPDDQRSRKQEAAPDGYAFDEIGPALFQEVIDRSPSAEGKLSLTTSEAKDLAKAGSLAPSGGNAQPWTFLHHGGRLFLFHDKERARSALDPGSRYAYLSFGACLENILLHAGSLGLVMGNTYQPIPELPQLVAVLELEERSRRTLLSPADTILASQIEARCTNRRPSTTLELETEVADALAMVVDETTPQARIHLVRERGSIERIAELCGRAERIRFLNPNCHHDMFVREMRWNKEQAEATRDGIDLETLELSLSDRTGLLVASDPKATSLLKEWNGGKGVEKMASKAIKVSSALAIISLPDLSLESAFIGGRAMERFWLKATSLGLIAHPISAPIFMGIHGRWDRSGILDPQEHRQAEAILAELNDVIGAPDRTPFFMLRLGTAGMPSARSLRLPLNAIFHTLESVTA